MIRIRHTTLNKSCLTYWLVLGFLSMIILNGLVFARYMEHEGHWVTGMNNQVVWGIPHIFAIFLILCASGVLNVASMASVFGRDDYKPWSRLSGLLSIALLLGGLAVLVLDLGRPDRLIIALTHYNFKSIFAWNIFLYSGLIVVVVLYLFLMFEPRFAKFAGRAGMIAMLWRLVLTTGTGSIFGFIVARQSWDSALLALLFIAMSLAMGTAFFIVYVRCCYLHGKLFKSVLPVTNLGKYLAGFVLTVLLITVVFHLTKLYGTQYHGYEQFILWHGGIYTVLFWLGYVLLGSLVPLLLILGQKDALPSRIVVASLLVIAGGVCQLYVIIIGGQAYPMEMFPGATVSSSFFDGEVASYVPSIPELSLGFGGVGFSVLVSLLVMRVLPFLPDEDYLASNPAAVGES